MSKDLLHETFERKNYHPMALLEHIAILEAQCAAMRGALLPFTHEDLQNAYGGNVEGEMSIIYQRGHAVLRLGHFNDALRALSPSVGQKVLDVVRAALEPFAKIEFRTIFGGNVEGDDSPVFQRSGAILRIKHFKAANEALSALGWKL